MTFRIKHFLNKIKLSKFWLSSKEYPVEILTDKTCSWIQKSVQLQIITITTTQNAREIRQIAGFFSHCALDVFLLA